MNQHIRIPKNVATSDDLDYAFLKKKGLEYIGKLAGGLWTDYNSHDPGITILDVLCYAITDLGARIDLPIENILAPENDLEPKISEQFFGPLQILPSKPVSETDYRKLFIDIDGVKNCWLKTFQKAVFVDSKNDKLSYDPAKLEKETGNFQLQGLYSLLVDFDELNNADFQTDILKEKEYNRIIGEITRVYHANRNLCEDLVEVSKVETHPISVCASIMIQPEVDEELVEAQILRAIDNYFSPSVPFYSLKQMFAKGFTAGEIFEGPVLSHGFIDTDELTASALRTEVRLSDLVNIIMNIEGVSAINDISVADDNQENTEPDPWLVCVEEGKKPVRSLQSAFSYYKGVLPVNVNKKKVAEYVAMLEKKEKEEQEKARFDGEMEIPEGIYLQTGETTTIQNHFPETYGIGQAGLPSRVETARKAKAKQLKGYLLFFDQVLASYFAHLAKVKELLSVNNLPDKTYFTQAVNDIKDFEDLVSGYNLSDPDELTHEFFAHLDKNIGRKNQLLDHLLARFAEKFSDYAFLMKQLYGSFAEKAIVQSKELFLSEYGEIVENGITVNKGISNWRGSGFNYFNQPVSELWDTTNVSGVQKRIARLTGMKDYRRRNLSGSFVEVYDFLDSDNRKVWRWRIRNTQNEIVLSATENYSSPRLAQNEMYRAVVRIAETSPEVIHEAFKNPVSDEQEVGNFEIQISEPNQYSFDVINPDAPPLSTARIIARQFTYYNSQQELENAILELIQFITTDFTEEGMFVVEHILLRPDVTRTDIPLNQFMPICTDKGTSCQPVDPYSYRVTVVLPGWTYRFSNRDFRIFMEQVIREEMPAHILARICWIGSQKNGDDNTENQMVDFEDCYRDFLLAKTNAGQTQSSSKLQKFIKILSELNSIYPTGKLMDCDDEADSTEGKIVLGSTNIGNL